MDVPCIVYGRDAEDLSTRGPTPEQCAVVGMASPRLLRCRCLAARRHKPGCRDPGHNRCTWICIAVHLPFGLQLRCRQTSTGRNSRPSRRPSVGSDGKIDTPRTVDGGLYAVGIVPVPEGLSGVADRPGAVQGALDSVKAFVPVEQDRMVPSCARARHPPHAAGGRSANRSEPSDLLSTMMLPLVPRFPITM